MQHGSSVEGIDKEALLSLARRCQTHLAQATATNLPSRRYSIILEELGGMSGKQDPTGSRNSGNETQLADINEANAAAVDEAIVAVSHVVDTAAFAEGDSMSAHLQDPFLHWQASDWLDLDASVSTKFHEPFCSNPGMQAYGLIPGLSPDFNWLDTPQDNAEFNATS